MKTLNAFLILAIFLISASCKEKQDTALRTSENLDYCVAQASRTIAMLPNDSLIPRNIAPDQDNWRLVDYKDWTSGFWPGVLWQLYAYTGDVQWEKQADHYSRLLTPLSVRPATDHDLGFQVYGSIGQGYRLNKNPEYRQILLKTADTLATLFNPIVGTKAGRRIPPFYYILLDITLMVRKSITPSSMRIIITWKH